LPGDVASFPASPAPTTLRACVSSAVYDQLFAICSRNLRPLNKFLHAHQAEFGKKIRGSQILGSKWLKTGS